MNAWTRYKPVCSEEAWNKHHWQTVSVYYVVCVDNWTIHLHPIFYLQYIHLLISHWFMLTAFIYLWIYSEFCRVWPHRCLECVCKTTAPVAAVTAPPASLVESPLPSLHIQYTKKYKSAGGRLQLSTHTPYVCGFAWCDMVHGCMVYTELAPRRLQFHVAPAMPAL